MEPMINSILDDDLYKLTMMQAVCQLYPRALARYGFINRGGTEFPDGFATELRAQIDHLATLRLLPEERRFLQERCYFMTPVFLDFLSGFSHDPREVHVSQSDGKLSVTVEGPWYRTILWEVKLMAIISELYFKLADRPVMIRDHVDGPGDRQRVAADKSRQLAEAGCVFSDFGSRRRYSYTCHDRVLTGLKERRSVGGCPGLVGTSNIHMAMKHDLLPIGTQAHEWYMFHAAKYGYRQATSVSLGRWIDVYNGNLGIALTDTFTTPVFFEAFDSMYARLYDGVRHDSADPIQFGEAAIEHYKNLHIDPMSRSCVFSDGVITSEAINIQKHFQDRIRSPFGIGTHFTNDVGVKPLNMVIKMLAAKYNGRWVDTIKLSDIAEKNTGNVSEINLCKGMLGLQ